MIGDLRTVALVGTDGCIDWFCTPHFDSPSVFGSILDAARGGHYSIAPVDDGWTPRQLYIPDTNVLITRFMTPRGVCEIEDFMPVASRADSLHAGAIVRRVVGVRGDMKLRVEIEPRFDYARAEHDVREYPDGIVFAAPSRALAFTGAPTLERTEQGASSEFTISEGEQLTLILEPTVEGEAPRARPPAFGEQLFTETIEYWRAWIAKSRYRGRWREMVHRSALVLKLLTFQPTGAIVAAPTTSLPEQIGGERNWDYRYTWIRDAAFTIYALLRLGFTEEADAFSGFLRGRIFARDRRTQGPLQIMYGIDGRTELPELTLDHLEGYRGSAPVRIGNGAADQLQLDIYGELIDSIYLFNKFGRPIFHEAWDAIMRLVDWVCENWDQADEGIWETRGGRQNFTYSRVMSWVSIERAIRIANQRGLPAELPRWHAARDAIYHQVMSKGWSAQRGAFVQHYDTDVLDASIMIMPLVKFIAPTDPRWLSTLDAIGKELVSDSLVYRYNVEASPDGLRGEEGTFSICSFWYVEALARAGRLDEAQLALEKMFTYANHVGLYSEEIGPTGEQLGNFPQAFTHLALISAAHNLDRQLGS